MSKGGLTAFMGKECLNERSFAKGNEMGLSSLADVAASLVSAGDASVGLDLSADVSSSFLLPDGGGLHRPLRHGLQPGELALGQLAVVENTIFFCFQSELFWGGEVLQSNLFN